MSDEPRMPGDWVSTEELGVQQLWGNGAEGGDASTEMEEEQPLGAALLRRNRRKPRGTVALDRGGAVLGQRFAGFVNYRLVGWVMLLGVMAMVSVALRNYNFRLWVKEQDLQREVKERRRESIVLTSRLMRMSRETQVSLQVEARGLDIRESRRPPVVVELKER